MKKTTLFIVLIALSRVCFAQSNVVEAHFKGGDTNFNDAFKKIYNEARANDQIHGCIISVTFAKFTIDTLGNVGKISFSDDKDAPPFIRKLLQDVILTSNGLWVPCTINGKKVQSKPFILPLMYELEAGCSTKQAENKAGQVLSNMFNFNDGGDPGSPFIQFNLFNCILFPPITIFSQR